MAKRSGRAWAWLLCTAVGIAGIVLVLWWYAGQEPALDGPSWRLGAGIAAIGAAVAGAVVIVLLERLRTARRERMASHGVRGTARVLAASDTGAADRDRPILRLRLRVEAPGIEPYEVDRTVAVSTLQRPLLNAGPVDVRVEPRTLRIEIDWERTAARAGVARPAVSTDGAGAAAVFDILARNALPTEGALDLRDRPDVRADVLRAVGIDPARPSAGATMSRTDRLREVDDLHASGAITDDEHADARRRILDEH